LKPETKLFWAAVALSITSRVMLLFIWITERLVVLTKRCDDRVNGIIEDHPELREEKTKIQWDQYQKSEQASK
jgi:hypothetical protein